MQRLLKNILMGGLVCFGAVAFLFLVGHFQRLVADQGWEQAIRIEMGYSATVSATSIPNSATLLSDVNRKRPDNTCRNNSPVPVWIGSASSLTPANGFPVLSSETFKTGAFFQQVWAYCDSGTCDIRCWQGNVP